MVRNNNVGFFSRYGLIRESDADLPRYIIYTRFILSFAFIFFQVYIIFKPMVPMLQRPLHVTFAIALIFLFKPLRIKGKIKIPFHIFDILCVLLILVMGLYFYFQAERIQSRIVFFDVVYPMDKVFCFILVALLFEATRRTVGYSLLLVVVFFFFYGWFGYLFPGWLRFEGINLNEYVELLFLGDSGIFGIPVETSLRFVFYFVFFGAIFSAVGGSRLLVETGFRLTHKQRGGAAKAAVIASSLMGTVSGSAVANVTTTGVFTIPFMIRSGYRRETAGAVEAIASTGGQLMPPIMGISAFVMAELLGIPYLRIALAAVLPAMLFYLSLYFLIDFMARRQAIGGVKLENAKNMERLRLTPYIHMYIPILVIVYFIVRGYSPTMAALYGCVSAFVLSFINGTTRLDIKKVWEMINNTGKQASSVAIPIASIGIIIGVAIQSNLALKFSSKLITISGGSLIFSLFFVIIGCIILGMGLPTVAAYIMGAVFFVPPLVNLGFIPLSAHFFVFYYSILAMVTPPVALASFTAAGLAESHVTKTGLIAFMMSMVAFMIPFVFIFRPVLLWEGPLIQILERMVYSAGGVIAWAAALAGYIGKKLSIIPRVLFGICGILILMPTGRILTYGALGLAVFLFIIINFFGAKLKLKTSVI